MKAVAMTEAAVTTEAAASRTTRRMRMLTRFYGATTKTASR